MSPVKTATARARIRPDIKREAEGIIHDLGLSVSNAFELFYRQIILHRGLPFDVRIPNETTRRAIEDARKGRGGKFATAEALFKDLGKRPDAAGRVSRSPAQGRVQGLPRMSHRG